ncbi:hypothetical protein GLOIN_2v1774491 [Rhizophagus irregularis DAOM 181602=DAOM 197198]|nr:hypothetical protein GLOIN_2v1774491 [Rhizophagus irregularis DAOM 181602=DAOM 197198]
MRKRASDIRIPKNMPVYEIELANVTENHPLEDGIFIIILSDNKTDAHINVRVDSINNLSYISIHLYIHLYGGMFTRQSRIGRYLFTHISYKEIVYHLGQLDHIANEVKL